jgi:hypothetical protein
MSALTFYVAGVMTEALAASAQVLPRFMLQGRAR